MFNPQTFYPTSRNSVNDDLLKSSYSERGDPLPVSCKGVLNDSIDRVYHVNSLDMNMLSTNRLREKDCWFI